MYRKTLMAIAIAVVCAFGSVGLVACGGSQGGSVSAGASGSAAASASADASSSSVDKTAEYQKAIADDAVAQVTAIMRSGFDQIIASDPNWQQLTSMGLDVDAFAGKFMSLIKLEVSSVDVDGDTAVAHMVGTVPDIDSEEANAAMTQALEKFTQDLDPNNASKDELLAKLGDIMVEGLNDPSVPAITESFDIDYVKSGETWTIKDKDALESSITTGMLSGAGQASSSSN